MELNEAVSLGMLIYAVIVLIIFSIIAPKRGWHELRRIPALDAIDTAIRACVERGKSTYHSLGVTRKGPLLLASCAVAREEARIAGELGVRATGTARHPIGALQLQDFAREGYAMAGHPERFNFDDWRQLASDIVGWCYPMFYEMELAEKEPLGLIVWMGWIAGGAPVNEICAEKGITTVWGDEGVFDAPPVIFADHPLIGDEMFAAGAYLSRDPVLQATLAGEDLIKILFIAIPIVVAILLASGVIL